MPANYQSRITLWDLRISNQEFVSFILRILRLFFLAITKKKKKKKPIFINSCALFIKIIPKANVLTLKTPDNYSFLSSFLPLLLKLSLSLSFLLLFSLSLWISRALSRLLSLLPFFPPSNLSLDLT